MNMEREQAETIALQVLSFLVRDDKLLSHFLMMSGLTPQELKKRVREPDLLGGVLDALLADDKILLEFCTSTHLSPDTIIKARRALPGDVTIE